MPDSDESDDPEEASPPEFDDASDPVVVGGVVDGATVVFGGFVTGAGLHVTGGGLSGVSDDPDELSDTKTVVLPDPEDDETSEFPSDMDELDPEGGDVVVGPCVCGVLVTGGGLNVI